MAEAIVRERHNYKFIKHAWSDEKNGRCVVGLLFSTLGWDGGKYSAPIMDFGHKLYEEYGMTSTDIWDMSDRNDKEWHSFADAVVYLGYGDLILGQNSSPKSLCNMHVKPKSHRAGHRVRNEV
jgi:hypothetical protein